MRFQIACFYGDPAPAKQLTLRWMGMLMDGFLQDLSPISYDIVLLVHLIFSSSVILSLTHPLSQIFHIASWDLRGSPDIFCHKKKKKWN